jgi:glycosyltransferase involved in cell wall biosynthesis
MRVAMLVQKVDERDWLMSFALKWIRALAARVDRVDVIALERREADLPANVFVQSMGKERGYGRARELIAFYGALGSIIRDVDVIFSHMTPRYVLTSAPLAIPFRKPQVLWFTHRQTSLELRLATVLSRYVVSAVPDSFPLRTPKLRVLGHGIDTDFYAPDLTCVPDVPPLIVYVARLMPIKRQDALLKAIGTGIEARVALVGDVPAGHDASYLEMLKGLAHDLGIEDQVTFTGGLLAEAVRDLLRRATLAVNLSPPGLFDKAALESMLVGVPTLVSNPAFNDLLGEHVPRQSIADPNDTLALADRLGALLALPAGERQRMAADIRERVRAAHSLDGLMDKLVALMASLK